MQELVSCMPNNDECGGVGGCQGATAELAFDYLAQYGLPELWIYGYLPEGTLPTTIFSIITRFSVLELVHEHKWCLFA